MTTNQDRFRRQIAFKPVGVDGQRMLANAKVAVVGLGALGSTIAERLARCGVGYLRLIDRDWVELDNLPRQALYTLHDAEYHATKAIAAAEHLSQIDPTTKLDPIVADVTHKNIRQLLHGIDLVVDGTDNFEVRYLINDACVATGLPWIHGGIVGASGQAMLIEPEHTACFRCLLPEAPPPSIAGSCDTVGVIGPAVGVIASWQALLAVQWLVERKEQDPAKRPSVLTVFDLWLGDVRKIQLHRVPSCPCCGQKQFPFLDGQHSTDAQVMCGKNAVQVQVSSGIRIDLPELAEKLKSQGEVVATPFLVRFSQDNCTLTVFADGRAVVHGTEDPAVARKIYQRWVGG
jgi:adenylyltransferase/sulfurtransferase